MMLKKKLNSLDLEKFGYYGVTKMRTQPGDVLYSSVSRDTAFVGHIGIIGDDGFVYHVLRGNQATRTSLPRYMKRFSKQNLYILRPHSNKIAKQAGQAAMTIHPEIESYTFNKTLANVKENYCSKFIWQAFYYGAGIDVLGRNYTNDSSSYILPMSLKSSPYLAHLLVISKVV